MKALFKGHRFQSAEVVKEAMMMVVAVALKVT
jgi:hypothetical protein